MQDISGEIITKASSGDIESFEKLFRAYSGFVYNIALGMLRSREDANEVTQDVFVAIYRKLKTFRFQSSLRTWIYRVTVNLALNHLKKTSRFKTKETEYNDDIVYRQSQSSTEESIDRGCHENVINVLLNSLSLEQRVCVVLRNIEGLSYKEIADTLQIKLNAVRSRLRRAREKLLSLKKEVMSNEL